jgi:hypothetical protein
LAREHLHAASDQQDNAELLGHLADDVAFTGHLPTSYAGAAHPRCWHYGLFVNQLFKKIFETGQG